MVIGEIVLTTIVDAVIGYAFEKGADRLGDRAREKLGRDPTKKGAERSVESGL